MCVWMGGGVWPPHCSYVVAMQIEEMVLSQLAWTSDSPLFDAIDAAGSVPPYKDVALPNVAGVGRSIASPMIHPRLRKLGARIPESPLSALHDRHTSPGSTARRALFSPGGSVRKSPIPIAPKPPPQVKGGTVTIQRLPEALKMQLQQQGNFISPTKDPLGLGGSRGDMVVVGAPDQEVSSTLTSPRNHHHATPTKSGPLVLGVSDHITLASTVLSPSKGGGTITLSNVHPLIPISPPIPSVTVTQTTPLRQAGNTPRANVTSPKPKRTGSLALFYRKTYQLAFIRIKDLCERLALPADFTQK